MWRVAGVIAFLAAVVWGTYHYYGGASQELDAFAFLLGVLVLGALEG